jgi:hypothetical protein
LEVSLDAFFGWSLYGPFWLTKKRNRRRDVSGAEAQARVERQIGRTNHSRLGGLACRAERALLARGIAPPFGIRSALVFERSS